MNYKKILLGTNVFFPSWLPSIKKINLPCIFLFDFKNDLEKNIEKCKIDYIIPMSDMDYKLASKTKYAKKIIYPSDENINLLNNKLNFTKFMLEHFPAYIPKVYYLENIKLNDNIQYPLISKPIYSTNGKNVILVPDSKTLNSNLCANKIIIQEFIELRNEFSAFFLCIEGKIINIEIIKNEFPPMHIKKKNFINYTKVNDEHLTKIFEEITVKINYSGGGTIDFKYNDETKQIYIFEFNPRFGGSAFTNNFIDKLLLC